MIGKACISVVKYYNVVTRRQSFKQRPVLIIGEADSTDYVALPISRVTNQSNLDQTFDFPMDIQSFSLKLTAKSYIRAHKQFIVSKPEITKTICDFKKEYPDSFIEVLSLVETFQKDMLSFAL